MQPGELPHPDHPAPGRSPSDRIRRGEAMLIALREALDKVYPPADPQRHILARDCCSLSGQTYCRETLCDQDRPHGACPYLDQAPARPAVMPPL